MKWLTLLAILSLTGCGGGSNSSNPSSPNPTPTGQVLQAGQWEFTFPLTGSAINDVGYMEANVQVSNGNISVAASGLQGYAPYFSPSVAPTDWFINGQIFTNGFVLCQGISGETVAGSITSSTFKASVNSSNGVDYGDLTAQIPASGSTVSYLSGNWSFTGTSADYAPWTCENGSDTSGTFTAQYISPLSGAYSGTLNTSSGGTDVVAIVATQSGFSVSGTGTASPATLGPSFTISGANVAGALMWGTGISSNSNVLPFNFGARINSSGNSLDIALHYGIGGGSGDNVEWGTLTKN
jgi:hypothetical protein